MMTTNNEYVEKRLGENASIVDETGVLARPRRRHLLYCLCFHSNPMPLPAVADQVTVWEDFESSLTYEQKRLRIYNALYHDHLPVLQAADLVEYHQADDLVALGTQAARIEPIVHSAFEDEIDELLQAEGQSMAHDH